MSVQELHAVAIQAQSSCSRSKGKGKLQSLVEILDHYSPILDVLSQSHSDYTALLWGTMRWLLQVTMNYFKLLRRLSVMLEEIGDNLPRFMLYERIFSTDHMSRIISKLYAAIIQFLYEAVAFWKRHQVRKFFVAFWTPFEVKFSDTVDKIHRLQECVEKDATATEIVQRRIQGLRIEEQLREGSLVTRHTLQAVLEVKERQTILLLMTIRQQMFTSFECKSEYQEECIRVYTTFWSQAWEETMKTEAKFSSWHHVPQSRLTYVQAEGLEPMLTVAQLLYDSRHSKSVRRVILFWGAGMTKESAIAALIFGILTKHAEKLLYREMSGFYAKKFSRVSPSFDELWKILTEIMCVLPELHCTIHVASYEPQATEFVASLVQLALHSRHGKLDLLIYHPTINALSDTPGWIELDNDYDVDFDVNACDSLLRLVLLQADHYEDLSITMQTYIWMTTWRAFRYNLMSLAFHQTCHTIRPDVKQHDGARPLPAYRYETRAYRQAAALLKRRIIAFLQIIPIEMPPVVQKRLQQISGSSLNQTQAYDPLQGATFQVYEAKVKPQPVPPSDQNRAEIWTCIRAKFEKAISELFEERILDVLSAMPGLDTHTNSSVLRARDFDSIQTTMNMVGIDVFSQQEWDGAELHHLLFELERVLSDAIETGLSLTQQFVFPW
jgi:hypothetical protein